MLLTRRTVLTTVGAGALVSPFVPAIGGGATATPAIIAVPATLIVGSTGPVEADILSYRDEALGFARMLDDLAQTAGRMERGEIGPGRFAEACRAYAETPRWGCYRVLRHAREAERDAKIAAIA